MDDLVKPDLPKCMMPDGGEACAYVAWQAARIEALEAGLDELQRMLHELLKRMPEKN